MSNASDTPDQAEVLRLVLRHRLSRVWTALPGVIEKYDASTQRADVRPAVVAFLPLLDGEEREKLPVIPNVPVVHPSGGGFFCSFPMKRGDPVVLVFCARDIAAWKGGNGGVAEAADNRMHDLTDAFAFPGAKPSGAVLKEADAEKLVVGQDGGHQIRIGGDVIDIGTSGGAKQAAALAEKTKSELEALKTTVNNFIGGTWSTFITAYNTFISAVATHGHTSTATFQPKDPSSGGQSVTVAAAGSIPAVPASPGAEHGSVGDVGSGSVNIEEQ